MVFTSPLPSIDIPNISLSSFVLEKTEQLGDKPALIDGSSGQFISYSELGRQAKCLAAGLAQRGFKRGDVLGIFSPNCPEYGIVFHGVILAGGTNTTVNPLYRAEELSKQLNDCHARFLVCHSSCLQTALEAHPSTSVEEIFVIGEEGGATSLSMLYGDENQSPDIEVDPDTDLIALPYSSGTTGLPKGVMLSHSNLVSNLYQFENFEPTGEDDTLIAVLPFYHIYGMTVILNSALRHGARVVCMLRFDLEQFLNLMQKYEVTRAYLVPPIVLALAKHPMVEKFRFPKLKTIMSGAAPLGAELAEDCAQRLGCTVKQGYGLTETSPVTHINPEPPGRVVPGSIGICIPNTECRIVDYENGNDLGTGEQGELWIRGPQVMKGYLNNPEATKQTIDSDGWLHTGDIAEVDEDGYFKVVDRVKELIKYKGYQVAPAELEALLLTHPSVADCAVVPVEDDEAGEIPVGYVVYKEGLEETPETIMGFIAQQVAPQKKIRRIKQVEQIPKSPSGKILRRLLRNQAI
ncbi:MAG: 4-coumarate--CoA ligase family protein [Deltaproteobacteria bacterium]|nr:4-coumarate--CoA ligase family protein [Deltaproteobacteria bacterium]